MPIYEFKCLKCDHQFEILQKLSDLPPAQCPSCGSKKISQVLSAPAFQFKGTGWYVTDYAKKSPTEASPGISSNEKSGKSESKPPDPPATTPAPEKSSTEKTPDKPEKK